MDRSADRAWTRRRHGHRRSPRAPPAGRRHRSPRCRRFGSGDLLPAGGCARLELGPDARRIGRQRHWRGGARARRVGRARPGPQHQTASRWRALLRVPVGGPVSQRQARRRHGAGHPVPRRRHEHQALRRQQPGVVPIRRRRHRRRAHAARDLPHRFRDRGQGRGAVDGHVQLQHRQRHLRLRAPRAAHDHPPRRVGFRRPGDERLGRGERPRRRHQRGPRRRDAVELRCIRRRHHRSAVQRAASGRRPRPLCDPGRRTDAARSARRCRA